MAEGSSRPTLTAHEVAQLLEDDDDSGEIFYPGSDDELGMVEMEVDSCDEDSDSDNYDEDDSDSLYVVYRHYNIIITVNLHFIGKLTATENTT